MVDAQTMVFLFAIVSVIIGFVFTLFKHRNMTRSYRTEIWKTSSPIPR